MKKIALHKKEADENNTKRGVMWKEIAITAKLSTKSAQNMKVTDQISAKGENFLNGNNPHSKDI